MALLSYSGTIGGLPPITHTLQRLDGAEWEDVEIITPGTPFEVSDEEETYRVRSVDSLPTPQAVVSDEYVYMPVTGYRITVADVNIPEACIPLTGFGASIQIAAGASIDDEYDLMLEDAGTGFNFLVDTLPCPSLEVTEYTTQENCTGPGGLLSGQDQVVVRIADSGASSFVRIDSLSMIAATGGSQIRLFNAVFDLADLPVPGGDPLVLENASLAIGGNLGGTVTIEALTS